MNLVNLLRSAALALRALGPYVLLELVMPGGTILAVLLYLYRRRMNERNDAHVEFVGPCSS